jgi:hypothetical protein
MTGMICSSAKNCMFYRAVYGTTNFNDPVINPYQEPYICKALKEFIEYLAKGPARLTKQSLDLLKGNNLECVVLEKINFNLKPQPLSTRIKTHKIHTFKKQE